MPRAHRGHAESPATRAKIAARLRGKHHPHKGSHTHHAHHGHEKHKGHKESAETRSRIAAALKGRHHTRRR